MSLDILDSAFVKYLLTLSSQERKKHLIECLQGELYFELASKFGTFDPDKITEKLEKMKDVTSE